MPSYNFDITKSVLNEGDKNRILCIFFSSNPSGMEWTKAAKHSGSASVHSFQVLYYKMMRNIADAGGRLDGGGTGKAKSTPVNAKRRKRRIKDESSDDDGEMEWTPRPKRGRRSANCEEPIENESLIDIGDGGGEYGGDEAVCAMEEECAD